MPTIHPAHSTDGITESKCEEVKCDYLIDFDDIDLSAFDDVSDDPDQSNAETISLFDKLIRSSIAIIYDEYRLENIDRETMAKAIIASIPSSMQSTVQLKTNDNQLKIEAQKAKVDAQLKMQQLRLEEDKAYREITNLTIQIGLEVDKTRQEIKNLIAQEEKILQEVENLTIQNRWANPRYKGEAGAYYAKGRMAQSREVAALKETLWQANVHARQIKGFTDDFRVRSIDTVLKQWGVIYSADPDAALLPKGTSKTANGHEGFGETVDALINALRKETADDDSNLKPDVIVDGSGDTVRVHSPKDSCIGTNNCPEQEQNSIWFDTELDN
jgi:hypothetical protein